MEFEKDVESPVIQEAVPVETRVMTNQQQNLTGLNELVPMIDLDDTDSSSPELPPAEEVLEEAISRPGPDNPRLFNHFNLLEIRNRDQVLYEIENLSKIKLEKILNEFNNYHRQYNYLKNEFESTIDRIQLRTEEEMEISEIEQNPELKRLNILMTILKNHYLWNLDNFNEELNHNKILNKELNEELYLGNKHKAIKDRINKWRSRCVKNKYTIKRVDEWCLELVIKIQDIRNNIASSSSSSNNN